MSSFASSFTEPLEPAPARRLRVWLCRSGIALVLVSTVAVSGYAFWEAYSTFGARPWDFGFLLRPLFGADRALPSRAEVIVGLGWALLCPMVALVAMVAIERMLTRFGRTLTWAGEAALAAPMVLVAMAPLFLAIANFHVSGIVISTVFSEHRHARAALVEKGLAQEAKILDARFAERLRDIFRDR